MLTGPLEYLREFGVLHSDRVPGAAALKAIEFRSKPIEVRSKQPRLQRARARASESP